jgi:hypothetical protein
MLAGLLHRWAEAAEHFERAKTLCEAMGARAVLARALFEEARMLRTRDLAGDDARAADLLTEAAALSGELELPGIAERVAQLSRAG